MAFSSYWWDSHSSSCIFDGSLVSLTIGSHNIRLPNTVNDKQAKFRQQHKNVIA